MTARSNSAAGAPSWVTIVNPIARRLLRAGLPMGPNALLTVRGRTSGMPRATPLAIIDHAGRRWVWSPWGDVHWVRNLRAAGSATLTVRGNEEEVIATELDATERVTFFRDVLVPVARAMPFGVQFVRIVDGVDLSQPDLESHGRRVFELHARDDGRGATRR